MKSSLLILLTVAVYGSMYAQEPEGPMSPSLITKAAYMKEIPSIASQLATGQFMEAEELNREVNPKRSDGNQAVPRKGLPIGADPLLLDQSKAATVKGKDPILTFISASSGVTPTDPTGAVGPNHFVNSWNSSFRIWDKSGNPLTPAASLGTIFPGQTLGDPIVMYDQLADRFIITEFYANGFLVGISQGPDPVNDGWFTYQFPTNSFPDYPKFSLWSDGYYVTANKNSGSAGTSNVVFALERDKMLIGDDDALMIGFPLPTIKTNGFYSPLGFNVNGSEMPAPGNAPIVYMQDDSWNGVADDHLKVWSINVNWDTPSSSTISTPQILNTQPFDGLFDGGSFSNLPQPSGPDIDALQATIMYMAQYRKFSDHNAVVFNFVVDLDGGDDLAGIRWFELRQDAEGELWEIYQEGTYAQPDGNSAFSGTICMDVLGNIALAYTVVGDNQVPALRYTGRYATDPLNVMTLEEETIIDGTQSDPDSRYGDYSQMTIDPLDDKTFWATGEYFTGGTRKNMVGAFKIASELAQDVGIISVDAPVNGILTDAEPITVTIRNYGVLTQTNIPVSYQVNDGAVVNEVFTGSLESNFSVQYTFNTTANFSVPGATYHIQTRTNLGSDQNIDNDTISGFVSHLYAEDLGVIEITSPVSGTDLSNDETVMVTLRNFGANNQSGFDVSYILNGGTPVTETIPGPLTSESNMVYSFDNPADFSAIGFHDLVVTSSLPGDGNTSNDTITATIVHSLCQPEQMCIQGVGVFNFQLGTINNQTGCDPNGYGNYTNLTVDLEQASTNDLTITTGYGDVFVKVWIDFNDNFVFETEEVVVNDYVIAEGQAAGTYTETISMVITGDDALGEHMLRIKTNYDASVPSDPCMNTMFGETEDYTVNVVLGTGVGIHNSEPNDLILINKGNNLFTASFDAVNIIETLVVTVHNIQGQTVIYNRVQNINGKYVYEFDMSYAPAGIYLLRLGSENFGKVERFAVQ